MPSSTKKHLVFASVLKPVNDVRMWERMGRSALASNIYTVSIVGAKIADRSILPNQYPIFGGKRLGLWRLTVGLDYLRFLWKTKPDIQIVSSPELIWTAVFYRIWFHKSRLVYDVRENYLANILKTDSYNLFLKPFLATAILLSEWICSKIADAVWIAELCYKTERRISFRRANYFPNAYDLNSGSRSMSEQSMKGISTINFLISGTIGKHYGTIEAIKWVEAFRKFKDAKLNILGYCADSKYRTQVMKEIDGKTWIDNSPLDQLIGHQEIIKATSNADVLLLPYLTNESTKDRMPTKLYEGLAWSVPMLIPKNKNWEKVIDIFDAGKPIDFTASITESWVEEFCNSTFYHLRKQTDQDIKIYWQDYESEYLRQLAQL